MLFNSEKKRSFSFKYVISVYFIISLLIQLDRILLGKYAIIKEHDTFDSFWPFQKAIAERVLSFQFPGWFPDYIGGLAFNNMDINWSSIPVLISAIFPDPISFIALISVEFLLCSLGCFYFLKYFFPKIRVETALFSGAVWAIGITNLTYWRVSDLVSIPLLLLCTDMLFKEVTNKGRAFAILGSLFCLLNIYFAKGAPFLAFFHLFFVYFSHRFNDEESYSRKKLCQSLLGFTIFWVSCFLVNLPVIISLLTTNQDGMRSMVDFNSYNNVSVFSYLKFSSYMFLRFPLRVATNNFGGIGAIIFLFALFKIRKGNRLEKSLLLLFLFIMIYVNFIDQAAWYQSLRTLLPLREYRLSRLMMVAPFIAFIVFANRVDDFINFLNTESKKKIIGIILAIGVLFGIRHTAHPYPSNFFEIITLIIGLSLLVCSVIYRGDKFKITIKLLLLFIFLERFIGFNLVKIAASRPPSYKHFFESDDFDKFRPKNKYDFRIAFYNTHPIIGTWNGLQVAGGYASQYPKRYGLYWASVVNFQKTFMVYPYKAYLEEFSTLKEKKEPQVVEKTFFNPSLLALNNVKYLYSRNEISSPDKLGLTLVDNGVSFYRKFGADRLFQVLQRSFESVDYFIYEIKEIHERCQVFYNVELLASRNELESSLKSNSRGLLKSKAFVVKENLSPKILDRLNQFSGFKKSVKCEISSYEDNIIKVNWRSDINGLLVLNETYTDDWKVSVNGKRSDIVPVYGFLRGVIVNKGENEIVFSYEPKMERSSYLISLGVILSFLSFSLFFFLRKEKEVISDK